MRAAGYPSQRTEVRMNLTLYRTPASTCAIYRWWRSHPKQVFLPDEVEKKCESLYIWVDEPCTLSYDELMKLREWSGIYKLGETLLKRLLTVRQEWSKK